MNIEDTLREVSKGPCGCNEDEYSYLHHIATADLKDIEGDLLEIGSWFGSSTVVLGSAAQELDCQLVSIDTFHLGFFTNEDAHEHDKGRDRFDLIRDNQRRIFDAGVRPWVQTHIGDSVRTGDTLELKAIRLLWIDGDHRYAKAREEFRRFAGSVSVGGVAVFHDCQMKGVTRSIADLITSGDLGNWTEQQLPEVGTPLMMDKYGISNKEYWRIRTFRKDA